MSFGLGVLDPAGRGPVKRLMFDDLGRTNNTCVRIDSRDYLFGQHDLVFPQPGASRPIKSGWPDGSTCARPWARTRPAGSATAMRSVWEVGRDCAIASAACR